MKQSTIDRRVKYTKKMLHEAVIHLLSQKTINEISVTELCKAADINRSTFYSHYRDAFDLLEELENETYENLYSIFESHQGHSVIGENEKILQEILDYVAANQKIFQILLRDYHNGKFQELIMQMTNSVLENEGIEVETPTRSYVGIFTISGSISIIREWLDSGMKETSEFMASFIYQMIKSGILGKM